MKRAAGLIFLCGLLMGWLAPIATAAPDQPTDEDPRLAAAEKDECEHNLKVIYDAIQAYRADHKDIPYWLSDLVPQYISDPNVLICPACKRTGQTEVGKLADPKLPCSYRYEFCPVPLSKAEAPGGAGKTRRDLKRQQMALVGSVVPIVRCPHHTNVLNLAFDGKIYESPELWQKNFTNEIDINQLIPSHIYPAKPHSADDDLPPVKLQFLPRDPLARPELIDLTSFFNAPLKGQWLSGIRGVDFSALPNGLQSFDGVEYDVRGIVQLASKSPATKRFPNRVDGIKIGKKCARLHFLDAADLGKPADKGEQIGHFIVHYGVSKMQLEIPVVYGRDVLDWNGKNTDKSKSDLTEAWSNGPVRLYTTTWTNVAPEVEIERIDFVSAMRGPAPLLMAVTVE